MEWECIIFGIANVFTNFLLAAGVMVIWRMERGRSNTLKTGGGEARGFPNGGVLARISGLFRKQPCPEEG